MGEFVVELIVGTIEALLEFLPALCYITAVVLIFSASFGRVAVEFPRNSAKLPWSWRNWIGKSPQGRTILSPALGTIIGLLFWIFAVGLTVVFYWYSATRSAG
jgi:hypothetical protein